MEEEKQNSVSVVHNRNHILHRSETTSPENPRRLTRILSYLEGRQKLFEDRQYVFYDTFPPATEEQILYVHDKEYLEFVKRYCERGGGFLGDSTYFSPKSYDVALSAVGGSLTSCRHVLDGKHDTSLALIRPPGHHASRDHFSGYCIFNNAAVCAKTIQKENGIGKIMIVDWDAHAGDGTMRIFYEDPTVLAISLHRDPKDYYPHDGYSHQIGRGAGLGYNVNVEMSVGSGDQEYMMVMKEIIAPLYDSFKPDFVIALNGFDSHHSDTSSGLQLTAAGYYKMVSYLMELNNNRLAVIQEGGYSADLPELTYAVLSALGKNPMPPIDDEIDTLSLSVVRQEKSRAKLINNVFEVKELLKPYHSF